MSTPASPAFPSHPRLQREARTVSAMIDISCSQIHGTAKGELCPQCADLRDYAMVRLARCPFQERKTTCGKCRVHCYRPDMRERAREAMRTAGPLMPARHPIMALRHLLDGRRKEPEKRK
jgi:uncharacterized protein with von Willebrand factor type A (vWA) domain